MPHDEEERTAFGMRFVFRMICKWSKAIITHSESNCKALSKLYRLKAEKISIIKHGNYLLQTKNVKRYSPSDAKENLGLSSNDKVMLFFGAVREYKGIMDLLLAIKRLSPNHLNLRLLIAGKAKSNIEEKIHSFIAENHLQKAIIFENRYIKLEEFGLYFDASDVVALPYKHSYGSGALQTAMAFSKPIILTDLSFFREIVIEGKNGLFFEYGNIESFSEMIVYFFSLPKEEQIRMAHNSLSIVEEDYRWQPIAAKTSSLYKQIAA